VPATVALRVCTVVLLMAVLAASCGLTADPEAVAATDPVDAATSTPSSAVVPSISRPSVVTQPRLLFQHRFSPTIAPGNETYVTYLEQSFERFVAEAEVVFTGRVRDVDIGVARTARFESGAELVTLVYDGIVFDVEEVLLGEVPGDSRDTVVLSLPVVTDYVDPGRADEPVESIGFEILQNGVEAAQRGQEGPLYIIFAGPVDIRGVRHLWPIGPAGLGVIEDGVISRTNDFVVDRQFDGSPMTLEVFKQWLTEGEPRWDPSPEFYPPEDAPPGPIAVPGEDSG